MRFKLRIKLVFLLAAVSFLPLLLGGSVIVFYMRSMQRNDAMDHSRQAARIAAAEVEVFITEQFGVLRTITHTYSGIAIDSKTQDILLGRFLHKASDFTDLAVVNALGKEIARKNFIKVITENDLADRRDSEEFIAVREKGRYVGPLVLAEGRPFFTIGEAIYDIQGSFLGAVFAKVDGRIMQQVVANALTGEKKVRVYIVDEKGIVVAHPNISHVLAESDFSFISIVSSIIQKPTTEKSFITSEYRNEMDEIVVGGSVPIQLHLLPSIALFGNEIKIPSETIRTDWWVIAEQPASVALRMVSYITKIVLIVLVSALVMAVLAAFLFARRIVGPIEKLHRASKELGKGHLKQRVVLNTHDEIEDLADSFNQMSGNLDRSIARLQKEHVSVMAEKNKLAIILSGITDGVIALDTSRNVIMFNSAAEQMTGLNADQVLNKSIDKVITVFDGQYILDSFQYCSVRADEFEGVLFNKSSLRIVSQADKEFFANIISGQIKGGMRIKLGCILTLHDVTREKRLERIKADFVSLAAHQLRTPLSILKWILSMFLDGDFGPFNETQLDAIKKARVTNDRIINLVNDLLDAARIEEGRYVYKMGLISIEKFAEEIFKEYKIKGEQKKLKMTFTVPETPMSLVKVDEEKMRIVFQNLLENAIFYTRTDGEILMAITGKDKVVEVSVSDTGIGIPKEEQKEMFRKFFRGANAMKVETDGNGLGLFVTKNIIEAHGGKIWFESEEGKGTTFFFTLPFDNKEK